MSANYEVTFNPNPKQGEFIEARDKASLYSSRMGEGKSTALAWSILYHTRHNPTARHAMIRDTWENLQATTMKTFFEWFPPGVMGDFHQGKKTFTWAEGVARGEVEFLGMDAPEDASKLMSRELSGFEVDEPAPAVGSAGIDELIFDIGLGRLRQGGDQIKWRSAKLAVNNPDETHWTYKRFVQPGNPGFKFYQPPAPENLANLPDNYYQELRGFWAHRPDLIRRFVDGEFGFQQEGKAVTPQWSDKVHLANGLVAMKGRELILLWDWGHNPTCIITQTTPMGGWNILEAHVGDGIGVEELIVDVVKPVLATRFKGYALRHIGDPQGKQREQTSIHRSALKLMLKQLGGQWRAGPVAWEARIEPLRSVLKRNDIVRVDRVRAAAVWQALRGGWHFHVARSGLISAEAKKDIHSHPGDAMSYGAAILYPLGKLPGTSRVGVPDKAVQDPWGHDGAVSFKIGPETKGIIVPDHGSKLILPS